MQGIDVDATGNIGVAAVSSDLTLVLSANSNLAAFMLSAHLQW